MSPSSLPRLSQDESRGSLLSGFHLYWLILHADPQLTDLLVQLSTNESAHWILSF